MAQTAQGQAKSQARWGKTAMGTQRKNESAQGKVAPALSPKVSVGKTKHNQSALNKNQLIENAKGSSPASVAGLGNPA